MEKNEITIDEIDVDIMLMDDVMKLFIENKVDVSDQGGSEAETRIDYIESFNRVKNIFIGLRENGELRLEAREEGE